MLPLSYHARNVLVRRTTTLLTLAGIALVVFVFTVVTGLSQGLRQLFVSTGSPDNLLFIRKGASTPAVSAVSEDVLPLVRYLPEVRRDEAGAPLVSAELVESLPVPTGVGGDTVVVDVRGVDPPAYRIHPGIRLVAGRAPDGGRPEVMLGVAVARQVHGAAVGSTIHLGRGTWTIVGLFSAGGSAYESEVWVDRRLLMQDRMRSDFSFVIAKVDSASLEATREIGRRLEQSPAIGTSLRTIAEMRYYAFLAQASTQIRAACLVLVVIMAAGMVFTVTNTMYGLTAARRREIGALMALGFGRREVLAGFLLESASMAALGGTVGALLGLVVNGLPFFYEGREFSFQVGPGVLVQGVLLAAAIGVMGGIAPAARAARTEVVQTLRSL